MYSYELKSDILRVFTAVHQARTFLHLLQYFGSKWSFDEVHLKGGSQCREVQHSFTKDPYWKKKEGRTPGKEKWKQNWAQKKTL